MEDQVLKECDCKQGVLEKVAEKMGIEVNQIRHTNYPLFSFGVKKPFIEVEVTTPWVTKKGIEKDKKAFISLFGNYCMFCGQKYPEEKS